MCLGSLLLFIDAEPGLCPEETMHTVYGIYTWPDMTAQKTYFMGCEKGDEDASRFW